MNIDNDDDDSVGSGEEEPEILLSEVHNAIHHLKSNKTLGLDEVPAALGSSSTLNESGATVIHRLRNDI